MPTLAKHLSAHAFLATAVAVSALCGGCQSQPRVDRAPRDLPAPDVRVPRSSPPAAPAQQDTRPVETAQPAEPVNKLSESYTLKVTGMTCRFVCEREVKAALLSVPGVTNVLIDHDTYRAIVHCNVGTNPDDLLAALQATGKYSGLVLPN